MTYFSKRVFLLLFCLQIVNQTRANGLCLQPRCNMVTGATLLPVVSDSRKFLICSGGKGTLSYCSEGRYFNYDKQLCQTTPIPHMCRNSAVHQINDDVVIGGGISTNEKPIKPIDSPKNVSVSKPVGKKENVTIGGGIKTTEKPTHSSGGKLESIGKPVDKESAVIGGGIPSPEKPVEIVFTYPTKDLSNPNYTDSTTIHPGTIETTTKYEDNSSNPNNITERCRKNSTTPFTCPEDLPDDRLFPHPDDEHLFYYCVEPGSVPICRECPDGLYFNPIKKVCDFKNDTTRYPEQGKTWKTCTTSNLSYYYADLRSNPDDCGKYDVCDHGRLITMPCPEGLHFNSRLKVCDYPANALCATPSK